MTSEPLEPSEIPARNARVKRSWDKRAQSYDKSIGFFERRLFGMEQRAWACSRARGDTLEVAVGTGLNLPLYDEGVRLTAVDLSPEMLAIARRRAAGLERAVDLREGDAHDLDFPGETFDTVLCTYSLCNIPDPHRAVGEMKRVLRDGGRLILVDHIRSAVKPGFWLQKGIELVTARLEGEHMTRRPLEHVKAHGFEIVERERLAPGAIVERLVAAKASA